MSNLELPAVVLDCGTGYTKLGYSGNVEPCSIFPTVISCSGGVKQRGSSSASPLADLDFPIGYEALQVSAGNTRALLNHGAVNSWDDMESFWQQCIFRKLRCDPANHRFLLTEPPMNPPESRERTAEVMFESFGVAGLYIGVQAVLALAGSFASQGLSGRPLTGTVVDSGDGVTHVVPVVDGFVAGSCVRSLPLAGASVTSFVQRLLRERGEPIPPELSMEAARQVKEAHCYVCQDMAKEFARHEDDPKKHHRKHSMADPRSGQDVSFDVGYERFLGPEIFFTPEIVNESVSPLPRVVDDAIQGCGIDARRSLYGNIVLSGGSTMFRDFGRRMRKDIKGIIASRASAGAQEVDVNVVAHYNQRCAVWFGGSVAASMPSFPSVCHSRADYEEHGPRICRRNIVFTDA
uniref:Actin-related protein 3-like n=2 Tax=Tetraselmis sp. GSL018 TaxID=582737 RepID=A0A061SHY4_9CHLO